MTLASVVRIVRPTIDMEMVCEADPTTTQPWMRSNAQETPWIGDAEPLSWSVDVPAWSGNRPNGRCRAMQ